MRYEDQHFIFEFWHYPTKYDDIVEYFTFDVGIFSFNIFQDCGYFFVSATFRSRWWTYARCHGLLSGNTGVLS